MKNVYIKIISGILIFGSALVLNPGFLNESDIFIVGVLCFLLPAFVLNGRRLYVWIIAYILLILSIWFFSIVPLVVKQTNCGSIMCGMDGRPFYALFVYFVILIILAFLQSINFIQKKMAEKELKAKGK